jgi:hypothetical protein
LTKDPDYLATLRKGWCLMCGRHEGVTIVPHHHTERRGLGQKADDRDAFPLCTWCHDDFHAGRGRFKGLDHEQRTQWQDRCVKLAHVIYLNEDVL